MIWNTLFEILWVVTRFVPGIMIDQIKRFRDLSHESVELGNNIPREEVHLAYRIYKFYTSLAESNNRGANSVEKNGSKSLFG